MKSLRHTLTRKSLLTLIFSIVLALLIVGISVFAAYTNSRHAQRTIATYDASGDRFSSNDLGKGYAKDNVKMVYSADVEHNPSTVVTICNYEHGKNAYPCEVDISYSLSARLVKYDPSVDARYVAVDAAYISANDLSDYNVTITKGLTSVTLGGATLSTSAFGGTLTSEAAHADAYAVTFDVEFATNTPNLYLEITANPNNASLPTLRGIFKAELRASGVSNAWSGSFQDDNTYPPATYDGYNYSISGVGSGTCILTWDSSKVALSYVSLAMLLAIDGATSTSNSVTFAVNSDEEGRYDLQFYKINIQSELWTDMNSTVVQLEFH